MSQPSPLTGRMDRRTVLGAVAGAAATWSVLDHHRRALSTILGAAERALWASIG
jgi:hypothetical protein